MDLKEKIYERLRQVPKGKVVTYGELAKACNSNAFRFVGTCMKTNPDPVKTPCYKVVLSNGEIGNYSGVGGVKSKISKLKSDGIEINNGKIDLNKFGWKFSK